MIPDGGEKCCRLGQSWPSHHPSAHLSVIITLQLYLWIHLLIQDQARRFVAQVMVASHHQVVLDVAQNLISTLARPSSQLAPRRCPAFIAPRARADSPPITHAPLVVVFT
eukprot:4099192-Pyramimonas_sp.AAC.1